MEGLTSSDPRWRRSVMAMRVLCPVMMVWCAMFSWFAYQSGQSFFLALDCFCLGVNSILTGIQWCVFKL